MPHFLTRPSRLAVLLLLLGLGLVVARPAAADGNPLLGPGAPAAEETAPPAASLLAPVGRVLLTFQAEADRRIGEQMAAIRDGETTSAFWVGLLLAFVYGAVHALGPGHGKIVVVGYFLSREARIGRGLLMGGQIALAHTLSAVVIVAFADWLLRRTFGGIPAEIPAVRATSYGLIVLIGGLMLWRALRPAPAHADHDHAPGHAGGCSSRHGEGGLLSLGIGLVPCTGSVLILLYAFANGILWAGLALVAMVAVGMALTMGALGLASVLARRLLVGRLAGGGTRALRALDVLGAALVTGMGLLLFATAL